MEAPRIIIKRPFYSWVPHMHVYLVGKLQHGKRQPPQLHHGPLSYFPSAIGLEVSRRLGSYPSASNTRVVMSRGKGICPGQQAGICRLRLPILGGQQTPRRK